MGGGGGDSGGGGGGGDDDDGNYGGGGTGGGRVCGCGRDSDAGVGEHDNDAGVGVGEHDVCLFFVRQRRVILSLNSIFLDADLMSTNRIFP